MFNVEWRNLRIRMTAWYVLLLLTMLFLFGAYLYFRLESSLLNQTDESLRVAAAQVLAYADDNAPAPHFVESDEYRHTARHLTQAGFSARLLDANGIFTQGFGRQNGPPWPGRPEAGLVTGKADKVKYHGGLWRFYTQRIDDKQGNPRGWVETGKALSFVQDALSSLYLNILIAIPVLVIVAGLGGVLLARRALQPIDHVTRTAESITTTDFSQRIHHAGPMDEVGRLAATFDRMLDRIQQAFERERRFTADASHELRTPLAAIKGKIGVALSRARMMEEYQTTLGEIEREADRLIRLSNDLLLLARIDQGRVQWQQDEIDVNDLLLSVVEQLEPLAHARSVMIETQMSRGLKATGSIDHLIRALLNIIHNAIKYAPPNSAVRVNCEAAADHIHIRVTDQGPGISAEMLPRLTERFFRAESDRSRETGGAGLGLAISHEIVRHHAGELAFFSEPKRGTTVSIKLPGGVLATPVLQ